MPLGAISSVKGNIGSLVARQRAKATSSAMIPMRPLLSRQQHISYSGSEGPSSQTDLVKSSVPQACLSPIVSASSSATSCLPKSSSSTGPISMQSPLDYEIQQHHQRGNIHSLADIDDRLQKITS